MSKVLVTFASSHGSTVDIAQTIAKVLRENCFIVDVKRIEAVKRLEEYDAVVLGSAIYIGEWLDTATTFLVKNAKTLNQQHVWLFSSGPTGEGNPVALLNGAVVPENLEEVIKEINPRDVVVFGGKIDLRRLRKNERLIVKAAKVPKGDFRNWHAIKFWAQQIADALKTVAIDAPSEVSLLPISD